MLSSFEGTIGIKTGFTMSAGRCLVVCAEREGMRLLSVVLNSPQMYERSTEILEKAFSEYKLIQLCDSAKERDGLRLLSDFSYPLSTDEQNHILIKSSVINPLPNKKGDFAGILYVYLKNNLIFSQNLYII